MTSTYLCNEWLDDSDRRLFDDMRKNNPRRYRVAGLGDWGVSEGMVYENWREEAFDIDAIRQQRGISSAFGLDFGYTNDPTALFCGLADMQEKIIYVFDEMYKRGMSNEAIYTEIDRIGYRKEKIIADSAEPTYPPASLPPLFIASPTVLIAHTRSFAPFVAFSSSRCSVL